MDCYYVLIKTEEHDQWGRAYTGYGIEAWSGSGTGQKRLHRVPDLFVSRERCREFVDLCNREQVASFHLLEVIDNLLG